MDTEKVIDGLKELSGFLFKEYGKAQAEEANLYYDRFLAVDNAIALLKEQEPILLKNQHKPYGHFVNANSPWISRCPKCGKKVEGKQTRFCKYCGQAVKWND